MRGTGPLELCNLKFTLYLFSFFLSQSFTFPQVYPDHQIDSTLKAGINSIILQKYSQAEETFNYLIKKNPELPLGKIYLAAVYIARAYDYKEEYDESKIDSLLEEARGQSQILLKKDQNNIWNKYFLALAYGYSAYFKSLTANWFVSINNGIDAINEFEEIITQDKSFYEAQIAIGTFKYWKSKKTEFLNWFPGYVDEKEEAIDILETAISHSTYNMYLAINSLIWIYIDQQKYQQAIEIADSALDKFPGSRFFMWGLARAYEGINPEKSVEVYNNILASLPSDKNHFNEIILKHLMAQQYIKMGKNQEALSLCNEILSIKIPDEKIKSDLENRLERVKELRRKLSH